MYNRKSSLTHFNVKGHISVYDNMQDAMYDRPSNGILTALTREADSVNRCIDWRLERVMETSDLSVIWRIDHGIVGEDDSFYILRKESGFFCRKGID